MEQVSDRGEWIVHSSPHPCRKKSSIFECVFVNTNSHTSVPYTPLHQGVCDQYKQFEYVSIDVNTTHSVVENAPFAKASDM